MQSQRRSNNHLSRLRSLITGIILATLAGCAQFDAVSTSLFMMPVDQEIQLGNEFEQQIAKEMTLVSDPQVVSYVRKVGNRVAAGAPLGEIQPEFFVVQNDEINAFAVPGGAVYVQTGLIKAAADEAELAGVMAHELGHVVHRHGAKQVSRQTGLQMIEQVLVGEGGQAAQLASSLLKQGVLFDYSREDERQADQVAVTTLYKAGYDPMGVRDFFNKLLETYGDNQSVVGSFFASHPPTSERVQNVTAMVQALPQRQYERPTSELKRIQGRL